MAEVRLLGPAVQFLDSLDKPEASEVIDLLELIRLNPEIDNRTKFRYPVPPIIVSAWRDSRFWIVYRVVTEDRIEIWNIGHAGESPGPFRQVVND